MTNMHEIVQNGVGVAKQIENPWQMMAVLILVIVTLLAAVVWGIYKLAIRSFQRDDTARQELLASERMHAEQTAKLREEKATDLKELVRENHQLIRKLDDTLAHNSDAIDRNSSAIDRLAVAVQSQAVQISGMHRTS